MRISTIHGACEIDSLPGQSQIAICHSLFVSGHARGKGAGHLLKRKQIKELYRLQYDYAMCTVAGDNERQKRILTQAGWKILVEFSNRRSVAVTEIWGYAL